MLTNCFSNMIRVVADMAREYPSNTATQVPNIIENAEAEIIMFAQSPNVSVYNETISPENFTPDAEKVNDVPNIIKAPSVTKHIANKAESRYPKLKSNLVSLRVGW